MRPLVLWTVVACVTLVGNISALAEVSADARAHYEAGLVAKHAKQYDKAIVQLKHAIELENDYLDAQWVLAWVYVAKEQKDLAGEHFRQLIRIAPDSEKGFQAKAALQRMKVAVPGHGAMRPVTAATGVSVAVQEGTQRAPRVVDYTVVRGGDEDLSFANVRRYERRIIVPRDAIDADIRLTLQQAMAELSLQRPGADALCIFVYFAGSQTDGVAYMRARWAPGGDWSRAGQGGEKRMSIDVVGWRPPPAHTGKRFGLTLEQRRVVFWELGFAEKRAQREAMAKHLYVGMREADVYKLGKLTNLLEAKYTALVREKWGLTEDQETAISLEGVKQQW